MNYLPQAEFEERLCPLILPRKIYFFFQNRRSIGGTQKREEKRREDGIGKSAKVAKVAKKRKIFTASILLLLREQA